MKRLFFLALLFVACTGQSVRPETDLETSVKAAVKNQQDMRDQFEAFQGTLTKIQTTMTAIVTSITTAIDQKFETFQGSQRLAFENFTGEMKSINESNTNSTAYGIGLVAVVLIFALALIWIMTRALRAFLTRRH